MQCSQLVELLFVACLKHGLLTGVSHISLTQKGFSGRIDHRAEKTKDPMDLIQCSVS